MIFGRGYGRPGDILSWKWLNNVLKMCRTNQLFLGQGSGLSMNKIDGIGTWVAVSRQPGTVFIGIVGSAGISARVGNVLGSGPVDLQLKDPTTGDYVDGGQTIFVDSVSSTTGGVPSGTWVTCGWQEDGTGTLLNVDCGN
jgi:hypothetical protein